jgi:hypothetical protein
VVVNHLHSQVEEAVVAGIRDAVLAVKGTLYGSQLGAVPLTDCGRIINISSSKTGLALPGTASTTCRRARSSS